MQHGVADDVGGYFVNPEPYEVRAPLPAASMALLVGFARLLREKAAGHFMPLAEALTE